MSNARRFLLCLVVVVAAGCATTRPVSRPCGANASTNLDRVVARYRAYSDDGLTQGTVYWCRHDLEVARHVLYGEGGLDGSGAVCSRRDRRSVDFRDLDARFAEAQSMAREVEEARGVRFVGIEHGRLVWKNVATGQEVPREVANRM